MLKERFKDSIQGLDRMCFDILIDKKGKAKKVVFMKDYFSPSISAEDLKRITTYIKSSMQWKPAWVPSGKGIRNFECSTYEFVNLPYVDSIISQPPAPKQMKN